MTRKEHSAHGGTRPEADAKEFVAAFWDRHWAQTDSAPGPGSMGSNPASPYLEREISTLPPGTALDAGCGSGAEAIWLARHGWQVTGVDIAAEALARAAERAKAGGVSERIGWLHADVTTWAPDARFDLVTTHYAHAAMPQLDLYQRIAKWVAPGGTVLIVGHRHADDGPNAARGHGHVAGQPPAVASVSAASVAARLDPERWQVVTADEPERTIAGPGGEEVMLRDVVVRATRR